MDVLIAVIGVFIGELYGNFVGGGSLVTQIALQNILQMDIKPAIALDNAAVIGSNLGMFFMLYRKHEIAWWFGLFTVFQILGALFGAWILVQISPDLLKGIFLLAIVGLVIKNLFFPEGEHHERGFRVTRLNLFFFSIAAFFIGTYNAAFVIGDWIIALLILTGIFSIKYQQAIFLLVCSMLISQPMATYKYYVNGLLDLSFLIPMLGATICGGLLAGYFLDKIHSEKLEQFLKYLSIGLVGYLVWGILG